MESKMSATLPAIRRVHLGTRNAKTFRDAYNAR